LFHFSSDYESGGEESKNINNAKTNTNTNTNTTTNTTDTGGTSFINGSTSSTSQTNSTSHQQPSSSTTQSSSLNKTGHDTLQAIKRLVPGSPPKKTSPLRSGVMLGNGNNGVLQHHDDGLDDLDLTELIEGKIKKEREKKMRGMVLFNVCKDKKKNGIG